MENLTNNINTNNFNRFLMNKIDEKEETKLVTPDYAYNNIDYNNYKSVKSLHDDCGKDLFQCNVICQKF